MSTDSTELTFVRCPSCRSLVPAVSTRCRMCGASLDASGKAEETEADNRKQARVRQRTMSQPRSELTSAAGQIRQQPPEPVEEDELPVAEEAAGAGEDPLGSYIEEVEENGNGQTASHREVEEDFDSEIDDLAEAETEEGSADSFVAEQPVVTEDPGRPERFDLSEPVSEAPVQSRPRVVVESGSRRMGHGVGLSFGKPRDDKADSPVGGGQIESKDANDSEGPSWKPVSPQPKSPLLDRRSNEGKRPGASPDKFRVAERDSRADPGMIQAPVEKTVVPEARTEKVQARDSQSRRPVEPVERKAESLRHSEAVRGRLFGWLVSYSHPDGTAIELREGRFFVTKSSLKPTDLIVDDESVSTPHALINVGAEGRFQLQDLMSDRGVFLRRRGGDTYQREDAAEVQHGDWLRFGDVEFLVCLIAHVGER